MKRKLSYLIILLLLFIPITIHAEVPEVDSKNIVMINLNNDEIIYEKGKDEIIKVASMQKVMTSIVAIEHIDNLEDTFVIKPGMFNSLDPDLAVVGLKSGDVVTYNDLLYGTMLRSGGDCAYALGIAVSGSEEEFVKLMNEKAIELGLENTYYTNTTGLDDPNQHSTVNDVAILMKYALNNKEFRRIINTPEYSILDIYSFTGPLYKARKNDMNYFFGGKTGYTEEAGLCLVSYATYNDVDYILVTAGADENKKDQNFYDQKALYEYFMTNYAYHDLITKNDIVTSIKTMYDENVDIKAKRTVSMYINNDVYKNDLKTIYEGKDVLDRSIKKGDKIGKFYIKYKDIVLYEEDVLSPITVHFILKDQLKLAFLIIVGSMILNIIIKIIMKKVRKTRRKKKYS